MGWRTVIMPNRVIDLSTLTQFTAVNLLSDPGHIGGPVIVPSCAQISLVWGQEDQKLAFNVLYGRYSGAFSGSVAQANAIATALTTGAAWTALALVLAPTTTFAGVRIRDVNSANNAIIASTNPSVPGTAATAALPNEMAAVITLRTAKTGPQNRGRMYVPGFAQGAVAGGNIISAAAVTAIGNWANTIPGALSGSGYTWVIGQPARAQYTGTTGTVHPARAATSTPVTSQVVRDNHWDTQRRRGLK